MTPAEKRVEELRAKLKAEEAKLARQQATAKAREAKATKKIEDRKKILIGAMIFETMRRNEATNSNILAKLNVFLKRQSERDVFGLGPVTEAAPIAEKQVA